MTDNFESKIKRIVGATRRVAPTPDCLDTTSIGLFCEGKLPRDEMVRCEEHIKSCFYCLRQLNEMQKLLYYQKQKAVLSPQLMERLKNLHVGATRWVAPFGQTPTSAIHRIAPTFRDFLLSPFRQWRYAVVSLASIAATIIITFAILKPERQTSVHPAIDPNSFVNIRALADDGKTISETQGVVVNANGLIASNLSPLAKATTVQVRLRDGTMYETKNLWMDENRNLAVMKIDNAGAGLKPAPTEDIKQVSIGQTVFLVGDSGQTGRKWKEALVSDFKTFPGRHKDGEIQYIQLASFSAQFNKGAIVDKDGKLIGIVITSEKNINLAVPLKDAENLTKGVPLPVSALKEVKFSSDALNLYMKGILARDSQRWDEAIEYFKKALALNPNLEGAHLELGYVYYRKQLYDGEAREYEAALRINAQNTDALFALATNLETRGFYEQAIKMFKKTVFLDPSDAEAYYELGLVYLAAGQKQKALDVYSKLKVLDPGAAEIVKRLIGVRR